MAQGWRDSGLVLAVRRLVARAVLVDDPGDRLAVRLALKSRRQDAQMADQVLSAAPGEATGPNPASPPPASVTYVTNITNITAPPEPEVPRKVQCQWCKRQTVASESACEFCGAPL